MSKLSELVNRKFLDSIELKNLEIETDQGWEPVSFIHKTIPYQKWTIQTESGLSLSCANDHIVFDQDFNEVFVKDLIPFVSRIITRNGSEIVSSCSSEEIEESMFDLTVDSENKRFFSNGILSHNSTIQLAITFVLFGKTLKKVNLLQLVNSINGKECLVEITFNSFQDEYVIKRGLKPAVFEIYKNGTLIKPSGSKDYQNYLEENILRTNFKTFTTVITIGGKNYASFMGQPKADRRKIIESLLDIDIFSMMNQVAKNKSYELQAIIREKKIEVKLLSSEIGYCKDSIQKTKDFLARTEDDSKEKLEIYFSRIRNLEENLKELDVSLERISNDFGGDIRTLDSAYEQKKSALVKQRSQSLKVKESIAKEKEFYLENDSCPRCNQTLDQELKSSVVSGLDSKLVSLDTKISAMESSLNELLNLHQEIQNTLTTYTDLLNKKSSFLTEKKNYLSIISELSKVSSSVSSSLDLVSQEQELNDKYEKLMVIKGELDESIDENDYYDFCQVLLKDDGVKTLIIKEYLPRINLFINTFLEQLDLFIDFQFDEHFNEMIKSRHLDSFSYESFSDGQKTKIDIALIFTWREISKLKNSLNTNILFCDELFDSSLSPESTELAIKLLDNLPPSINCFIISHKSELFETQVNRILRLSLVNNFTHLEEII